MLHGYTLVPEAGTWAYTTSHDNGVSSYSVQEPGSQNEYVCETPLGRNQAPRFSISSTQATGGVWGFDVWVVHQQLKLTKLSLTKRHTRPTFLYTRPLSLRERHTTGVTSGPEASRLTTQELCVPGSWYLLRSETAGRRNDETKEKKFLTNSPSAPSTPCTASAPWPRRASASPPR